MPKTPLSPLSDSEAVLTSTFCYITVETFVTMLGNLKRVNSFLSCPYHIWVKTSARHGNFTYGIETIYFIFEVGGHNVLLLMLGLSSAFPSLDHQILNNRLPRIADAESQSLQLDAIFLQ